MRFDIQGVEQIYNQFAKGTIGAHFDSIQLFPPFEIAGGGILRRGEYYSGCMWIKAYDSSIFQKKSDKLAVIATKKTEWHESSPDCVGYLLEDRKPVLSLCPADEEGLGRAMCFGGYGSLMKPFPGNAQDMEIDVKLMQNSFNAFIDALGVETESPVDVFPMDI